MFCEGDVMKVISGVLKSDLYKFENWFNFFNKGTENKHFNNEIVSITHFTEKQKQKVLRDVEDAFKVVAYAGQEFVSSISVEDGKLYWTAKDGSTGYFDDQWARENLLFFMG